MIKTHHLFLLLIALVGCSSAPVTINHYVLDTDFSYYQQTTQNRLPIVELNRMRLADYLDQDQLAMLTTANNLTLARRHVWAEPLGDSIRRAITNDVNAIGEWRLVNKSNALAISAQKSLSIDIDHLITRDSGDVVLAGRYWITAKGDDSKEHTFYFSRPLEQDGYAHAVLLKRQLIKELAQSMNWALREPN